MEIKEFVDKVKKLNVTDCETCPFWIKNKFESDCKLSSICINNDDYDIADLLKVEEYLKEKENEIKMM